MGEYRRKSGVADRTLPDRAVAVPPRPYSRWREPDQDAALRRLRAAFGFVEVLDVNNHEPARTG
jgi:hypothetical protein